MSLQLILHGSVDYSVKIKRMTIVLYILETAVRFGLEIVLYVHITYVEIWIFIYIYVIDEILEVLCY